MKRQFLFLCCLALVAGVLSESVRSVEEGPVASAERRVAPRGDRVGFAPSVVAGDAAPRNGGRHGRNLHDHESGGNDDYVDPDDADDEVDLDGDASPAEYVSEEERSRKQGGTGFKLVLLPTVVLGSLFTVCMIWRWWRTRKDSATAAYGRTVDDVLSELDIDGSQIEAVGMSYSDDVESQEEPPARHTQVEGRDML